MQKVTWLIVALIVVGAFVTGIAYEKTQISTPVPAKEMIVQVTEFTSDGPEGFSVLSVDNKTIPVGTHMMEFVTDGSHVRESNITHWGVVLYNT